MAKIVLRDGTNGARRKIIARLKSEMTHAFIGTTSTITLGATLTLFQVANVSSDQVARVRELRFNAFVLNVSNNQTTLITQMITGLHCFLIRFKTQMLFSKTIRFKWVVNGI